MKKISCLVVIGLLIISSSCNKPNVRVKLTSQIDTVSYYIGILYAKHMASNPGCEKVNPQAIAMAFDQVFSKDSIKVTDAEIQRKLQSYFGELQKVNAEKNLKEGQDFLEKNKNSPGIVVFPDGLQYKVIKEGNGPKPDSTDIVSVNYVGTTIDGKEFDSNAKTGQPAKFPVVGVIKGFSEALLRMKVGSKWKLFIPANLGYGERSNPRIKGNSVLIFDLELLDIEHKAPAKAPAKKK